MQTQAYVAVLTEEGVRSMKTYVTFGQNHAHDVNGQTFDKDCVAVIEAEDADAGRDLAFEIFGAKFGVSYSDDNWDASIMRFFPRGLMYV